MPNRKTTRSAQSKQRRSNTRTPQGSGVLLREHLRWEHSIDGTRLMEGLCEAISRHIRLPGRATVAVALWVIHTHCLAHSRISPRLAITSPVKRSGKTLLLTILEALVQRPLLTSNATVATVFRCVDKFRPTLLIDEADTFLDGKNELRGVLNSGHLFSGSVMRTVGRTHEPRIFRTFGAAAIAMIGKLPDTLADRSIEVAMQRKRPEDQVEPLRLDRPEHLEDLGRKIARWVADNGGDLADVDPIIPCELNDRAKDNWRPLLSLADLIGGEWPERARRSAMLLSTGDEASHSELLLADIFQIFEEGRSHDRVCCDACNGRERGTKQDRIFSHCLLLRLNALEERPWPEWKHGKPMTPTQLAALLRPFKIGPRTIRIKTSTAKGYYREDFEEAFERYLPPEEDAQE